MGIDIDEILKILKSAGIPKEAEELVDKVYTLQKGFNVDIF